MTSTWKYRLMHADDLAEKPAQSPFGAPGEDHLNKWGSEGWELAGVVPGGALNEATLIFKQPGD